MQRVKQTLRTNNGMAMILVLCIGALLVALSAAMVFAASMLTSTANRQLAEQEACELANSFSEVLQGQLNEPTSEFYKLLNENGASLPSEREVAFTVQGPLDEAEQIEVVLRKHPTDEIELDRYDRASKEETYSVTSEADLLEKLNLWQTEFVTDYYYDVTVKVTCKGATYASKRTYAHQARFEMEYVIYGTHYQWNPDNDPKRFESPSGNKSPAALDGEIIKAIYDLNTPLEARYSQMVAGAPRAVA